GSLIVQCQYGKEFKDNDKLWCKKSVFYCKDIVKTRGSGGKVRSGRVSIRDHPAKLSFTVTMERLTLEDAGSYECRVDTPWLSILDLSFKVEVAVQPALTTASSPESRTSSQRPPMSMPTHTWPLTTTEDTPSAHPQPGPLVINVHLLLLVLKVLLLLSMLSAVLWVNRPQRSSRSRCRHHDCEDQ
ncbi:CMRF35-like molecule 6, partial [Urocitellus parryii]